MTDTKDNRYDTASSFVAAEPAVTVEPARADLVRRQDVVHVVDRMIDGYMTQQRALLEQVGGETIGGGRNGFLSDADQVAERRQTSKMYLRHNLLLSALLTGGLSYLGYLAGAGGALAIATWLAGTGGLSLVLTHRAHVKEFDHSPEGIARHIIDAHWDVTSYEAETRRKAIEWEHDAEQRRQAAAERQAEHARQQAALRIAEIDARRRAIEAQRAPVETWSPAPPRRLTVERPEGLHGAIDAAPVHNDLEERRSVPGAPTAVEGGASWAGSLLSWVTDLYQPGNLTADGMIRCMVPWSQRSNWPDDDKARARMVLCSYRPALAVHTGNRWRWRVDLVGTLEQALQIVNQRL